MTVPKRGRSTDDFERLRAGRIDAPAALKRTIVAGAGRLGVDLVRRRGLAHPAGRRLRLMRSMRVDLVIDVGANEGQYARELRHFGYRDRIISIEPLSAPYALLAASAQGDPNWLVVQSAAGAADEETEMFVAANRGASSSILPMLPLHEVNAPDARIVGRELVHVRRLDDFLAAEIGAAARPFLKIDVQGFESQVLDGAARVLPEMVGLQVELSLFQLYRGAPTFREMIDRLSSDDFILAGLEPVFVAHDGRVLAVDGLFVRTSNVAT
jgi:FkbM family methyltransferase